MIKALLTFTVGVTPGLAIYITVQSVYVLGWRFDKILWCNAFWLDGARLPKAERDGGTCGAPPFSELRASDFTQFCTASL